MTKEDLIERLQRLLKTDIDLSFILKLEEHDIEKLIASIRERVENFES